MQKKELLYDPDISHLTSKDYKNVYEPAEDTWLFVDALEQEREFICNVVKPSICLEMGSGSGFVSTFLFHLLYKQTHIKEQLKHNAPDCLFFCTDINMDAANATRRTLDQNKVSSGEVIRTSFMEPLMKRLHGHIDILLFNPPYVPTPEDEMGTQDIRASWAGGVDGREVIDELLPLINTIMSPNGVFYLIALDDNRPEELMQILGKDGFDSKIIRSHNKGGEQLNVIKFWRVNGE